MWMEVVAVVVLVCFETSDIYRERDSEKRERISEFRSCVKVQVNVPNNQYGVCGRKATFN